MFDIILLGDPASGKATQADRLLKKYPLVDLDMGKQLRKIQSGRGNSKIKNVLKRTTNRGKLTPTRIVRDILRREIFAAPKSKGILFNGTPKMIGEARLVSSWLSKAGRKNDQIIFLYLTIPRKEIISRMTNRKEYFKGKFSKRADDSSDALKNRLKYYDENISEVVRYFKSKYFNKKINGRGTRKQIFDRITKAINEFKSKKR